MSDDKKDGLDEALTQVEAGPPARSGKAPATPVRLRVAGPVWCSSFNLPQAVGATLVIDKRGVEVSPEDAQDIIDLAAKSGVTITEVSEA